MSDTIDDGGPAWPCQQFDVGGKNSWTHPGMTLRDWFAGQALPQLIEWHRLSLKEDIIVDGADVYCEPLTPCDNIISDDKVEDVEHIARSTYLYADAMLEARKGGAA